MLYRSTVLVLSAWLVACGDDAAIPVDGCVPSLWYADNDGDGFGNEDSGVVSACVQPPGHVVEKTDCEDSNAMVFAGAVDTCGDGVDQDCAGGDTLCFAERDGWTLTSRHVVQGSTPDHITGTITFTKLSGSATTRGGGGCFVADLVDRDIGAATCTTDSDCTTPLVDSYGYCASPDGSGEAKRCWTRPGSGTTYCFRSMANTPGDKMLPEVPWRVENSDASVRWMIVGCLAEEATAGACGLTDATKYVRSNSPVTTRM